MKNACKIFLVTLAMPLLLIACGSGQQSTAPGDTTTKAKTDAAKPVEDVSKKDDVTKASEAPIRNPFQSYIIAKRMDTEQDVVVKGPLECCELSTFTVVAVLIMPGDKSYALVSSNAIDKAKRFIIHLGDKMGVNGGVVASITNNGITVRESIRDAEGNIASVNDLVLSMSESQDSGGAKGPVGAPVRRPSAPVRGR